MIAGEIDFAFIPKFLLDDLPSGSLHYRPLFYDRAVAIFDRGHPLATRPTVGKSDLDPYRMVAFHSGLMRVERRHLHAFSGGQSYRVTAFVPEVAIIPSLIRGSQDFAIVPDLFPGASELHPDIISCPLDPAIPMLEVGLAWGPMRDTDGAATAGWAI